MKRLVERLRYQALQSDSAGEDRNYKQRIKHAVKSCHGAVIENLDTDPEYYVAVETIAANKYVINIRTFLVYYDDLIIPYYLDCWLFTNIIYLVNLYLIQFLDSYFLS